MNMHTFKRGDEITRTAPTMDGGTMVQGDKYIVDRIVDHDMGSTLYVQGLPFGYAPESFELSAPDPSKVKAGDTVTLAGAHGTELVGPVEKVIRHTDGRLGFWVNQMTFYLGEFWTLTDHQPAPEPEPEWRAGTVGTAGTVRGLGYTGPVVRTDEHLLPWWTPTRVDGAHYHGEDDVTDFVPNVEIDPQN